MLSNYLTTFIRIITRHKIYSAINVAGLALGIAATLFLTFYILDELSYDQFHEDADRIYRMGWLTRFDGVEKKGWLIGPPTAEALQSEVPQIESVLRMMEWHSTPVELGDKKFVEKEVLLVDSNFFNFFSFKLLRGNPNTVLKGVNKVVLTQTAAKKYFNYDGTGSDPIGKILLVGADKTAMEVSGLAADPPSNSHFHFEVIASLESAKHSLEWKSENSWIGVLVHTYFKAHNQDDIGAITTHFPKFYATIYELAKDIFHGNREQAIKNGNELEFIVQPLTDIHLGGNVDYEFEPNGDRAYIEILGYTTLFIIFLACINFVNLSTARASQRAKEIGIRKTIGAFRMRLVKQFLAESFLYTLLAVVVAMGLILLLIVPVNLLMGKSLSLSMMLEPQYLLYIFLFSVTISLLAGIYPAFYLSAISPTQILKGRAKISGNFRSRNKLVIFQFVISTVLVISTLQVYRQVQYLKTANPGFDRENIIVIPNSISLNGKSEAFKEDLKRHPDVISISSSSHIPTQIDDVDGYQKKGQRVFQWVHHYEADYDHAETLGYKIKDGRFFSRDYPTDKQGLVINEAAAEAFEIYDLSEKHYIGFPPSDYNEVIGIVDNFNFASLKQNVDPLIMFFGGNNKISIRIAPGNLTDKIDLIEQTWKKYSNAPFEYAFMDDSLASMYASEEQFGTIILLFTLMAIVIACLGLLGLVTHMAELRTKEIGIRKVLGATVRQVTVLLSVDFVKPVFIAFVLAIPVSWYMLDRWLQGFAHRIDFSIPIAMMAGVGLILIALITVSYQSIKAAMGNPVDSLRGE